MNGYKRTQPIQPPEEPTPVEQIGFAEGYRGDAPAGVLPLDASPYLVDVRFDEMGIRKDWGYAQLGTAAFSRVLGLLDYKYVAGTKILQRIVRITRTPAGKALVELWFGAAWVPLQVSEDSINNLLLSIVATQGVVVFANGTEILSFTETVTEDIHGVDFPQVAYYTRGVVPASDSGGTIPSIEVTPADAYDNVYNIYFSVFVLGGSIYDVTVVAKRNGSTIGSRTIRIGTIFDAGVEAYDGLSVGGFLISATEAMVDGDIVTLDYTTVTPVTVRAADVVLDTPYTVTSTAPGPSTLLLTQASRILNNQVRFVTDVTIVSGSITVGFYYSNDGAATWNHVSGADLAISVTESDGSHTITFPDFTYAGANPLAEPWKAVALKIESTTNVSNTVTLKEYHYTSEPYVSILGASKSAGSDHYGVEYSSGIVEETQVQRLSLDAPGASYVFPFANRLVALRDSNDPQKLAFSTSGDITDWVGEGSGELFLVDSQADAVDELMAGVVIGQGVAALWRRRSIMRLLPTGNIDQAIGAVSWLDFVGTDSPHSVQGVQGGALFIAQDRMVYYLTTQLLQPVGEQILNVTKSVPRDRLQWISSSYNPVTGEYFLYLPIGDSTKATEEWIFEMNLFLEQQKIRWRKRSIVVECAAIVSTIAANVQDATRYTLLANGGEVYQLSPDYSDYDGVEFSGRWQSRNLNPKNSMAYHTLTNLFLMYDASLDTEVKIRYTPDGGLTWSAEDSIPVASSRTVAWAKPSEITGRDVRFELILENEDVKITGYRAELAERSKFDGG